MELLGVQEDLILGLDEKRMLIAIAQLKKDGHYEHLIYGINKRFGEKYEDLRNITRNLRKKGLIIGDKKKGYILSKKGWGLFRGLQNEVAATQ